MSKISFNVTAEEADLITRIAMRGAEVLGDKVDKLSLAMDLAACHANGCPLRLEDLLVAEKTAFIHDITGIMRHMDRETGELGNCFVPRLAKT